MILLTWLTFWMNAWSILKKIVWAKCQEWNTYQPLTCLCRSSFHIHQVPWAVDRRIINPRGLIWKITLLQPNRQVDKSLLLLSRLQTRSSPVCLHLRRGNACSHSSKCERSSRLFNYDWLTGPVVQVTIGAHPSGAMVSPTSFSRCMERFCEIIIVLELICWNVQLLNVTCVLLLNLQLFKYNWKCL